MPKLSVIIKLETGGNDAPKEFSLDYMNFLINGNEVPIGFNSSRAKAVSEDGRLCIKVETGYGLVEDDFETEGCYNNIYNEIRILKEEITAEYVANAKALVSVGVTSDVELTRVKSIKIIDKNTGEELEFRGNIDKCEIEMS